MKTPIFPLQACIFLWKKSKTQNACELMKLIQNLYSQKTNSQVNKPIENKNM